MNKIVHKQDQVYLIHALIGLLSRDQLYSSLVALGKFNRFQHVSPGVTPKR